MDRLVRYEQLHPNVAVAIRRVELGWLIIVNPGLARCARRVAIAQANQYADGFEMGWIYMPPQGGVDVCIDDAFMGVAAVTLPDQRVSHGVAIAASVLAPLTACAWMVQHFADVLAPVVGA